MMPIAYIGFFILNNSKKYPEKDKPSGTKAIVWNIAMLIAIIVSVASMGCYLYAQLFLVFDKIIEPGRRRCSFFFGVDYG